MENTNVRHSLKSTSCDYQNEQEGTQKKSQGLLQSKGQNNGQEKKNNPCSDTSIFSVALEDSPWQQNNAGTIYRQLSLLKSTPMLKESLDLTSQEYQFTQISETTNQNQESLTSLPVGFPVLAHQTQELEQDLNIQLPLFGEKDLDVLSRLNPASVLLNNLKELSNEDLELFLPPYIWQDTVSRLKQSRRESLEQDTRDSDYLSFPTLTSGQTSTTMRPAGQTKCEKWFRNKGLIPNGSQLGSEAIAMIMGFPPNWFDCLSPTEPQEESKADISQDEQLPQHKQRSPSAESSTSQKLLGDKLSIPCLVKQPHKQPFEGLIVGDRGSDFDVQVDDRVVTLPKLYVFPNFPQKKKCKTDNNISPSKNSGSRRKKGTGSGYINWRTIKKNGKDYKQTWFHYELWDKGRQVKSCAYIPKKMRSQIEKMNSEKVPVEEILRVLRRKNKRG